MHDDVPPNYPPNYDQWFKKPCWYIKEICYLAQGLHPDCIPGGIILESDEESGEIESRPAPVNNKALVIAIEFFYLIKRAIESGELKPAVLGGECFKPQDVIDYLNQNSVALPKGITLPQELQVQKKEVVTCNNNVQPLQGHVEPPKTSIQDSFWMKAAKEKANLIYKRCTESGSDPSNKAIAKIIEKEFGEENVLSNKGKRLNTDYILRHGLKGWNRSRK